MGRGAAEQDKQAGMRERQRRPLGNRVGLDTVPGQKRGPRDGTGAY